MAPLQAGAEDLARRSAEPFGLGVEVEWQAPTAGARLDPTLQEHVATAADRLGRSHRAMISGAGHDAQVLAPIIPTAMIFVPSRDGRSHSPLEATDPAQLAGGAEVLLHVLAYGYLDVATLQRVAAMMADAPRLSFADFRKQYALAYYAGTLFNSIRPRVAILPLPGTSVVDHAAHFDPDDTVVMFPMRRPQVAHDRLSSAVVGAGATLITIGDEYPNPASQRAEVHLVCHTKGVGVFDSQVAPMSVINLLFTATANQLGPAATERLSGLEAGHEHHHTFLD